MLILSVLFRVCPCGYIWNAFPTGLHPPDERRQVDRGQDHPDSRELDGVEQPEKPATLPPYPECF